MATLNVAARTITSAREDALTATAGIAWYIWCLVAAVTSVKVGGYWDISWHMSIGRDTFWTPAHMLIYSCGVLAGISCGYLILSTTFGHDAAAHGASVEVWRFRAPLGAFIAAWGGVAMLTSAPFDNWWHNAYGLDVKIFSPPHVVLETGALAVQIGCLILISGAMNRAQGTTRRNLNWLFLYVDAMILALGMTVTWEWTYRALMHDSRCYRAVALAVPVLLFGVARAAGGRWAGSIMMAIYSAWAMLMMWILPLFPAEPKLGPVYQRVTHFVPMEFPLLLIVPALILDVLGPRLVAWPRWLDSIAGGTVFLATFVAAQWPFADFLLSPAARNWFFGANYFAYFQWPNSYAVRHMFIPPEPAGQFWLGMGEALALAILSTWLGIAWGEWMRRVRR